MMNQGLVGMNMNLDVYDSDDWLVINKEAGTRARNDQGVLPNPTYKAWGQPAMLGKGGARGHDLVSWSSNSYNQGAGFMGRPPHFVNFGQNDKMMGKLGGQPPLRAAYYDEMGLRHGECDRSIIVIDSSDDDEEDDIDNSGRESKYVTKGKAQTKCVTQSLPSGSWAHPAFVPRPYYMSRVNVPSGVLHPEFANYGRKPVGRGVMSQPATCPPHSSRSGKDSPTGGMKRNFEKSGQNILKVDCYDDFDTEDDDECSDEDIGREDDGTQRNCSNQSGYRYQGQVGADLRLHHMWNLGHGVRPQTEAASYASKKEAYCNPYSLNGDKSTLSHGAEVVHKQFLTVEAPRQQSLLNQHTREGVLPGGSNPCFGAASCKISVKNGAQEVDILPETEPSGIDKKEHGAVFPEMYEASGTRESPHPAMELLWNLAHGVRPSETEAARYVGKKEAYYTPNINGNKSTLSHGAAGVNAKSLEAFQQKCLQSPYTGEWILPGGSNPISGAHTCERNAKNGGLKEEILSETESSDNYDDDDSQFDDNECNKLESRLAAESLQTFEIAEDTKEKKQYGKHHEEESSESTDVCAGELFQMEPKKMAEQSNAHISLFEDYKNRVKEVAKLVKFHITSKPEVDRCAAESEQLIKIHEEKIKMKKRHQEEEQELEKQFAAALRCFVEKQTTLKQSSFDFDSDASCEL